MNWDDVRVALAVAEEGSVSGAARALGVAASTVYRRLGGLEEGLDVRLFERLPEGYELTAAGESFVRAARTMAQAADKLEQQLAGHNQRIEGQVVITTTEGVGEELARALEELRREHPGLRYRLVLESALTSLLQREADLALRVTRQPPQSLWGRRLARVRFGVYGARDLVERLEAGGLLEGALRALREGSGMDEALGAVPWVVSGPAQFQNPLAVWERRRLPQEARIWEVNSRATAMGVVQAGGGLGVLSCWLADARQGLVRLGPVLEEIDLELWMLTHPDLREVARVRALMDHLGEALEQRRDGIEGRAPREVME